jgi:uncharacterized protein (TIRG00374 family)
MRSTIRTTIVLALATLLVAWFLRDVDLRGVIVEIGRAHPLWLLLSAVMMSANLAIRAWRWQYLLEPLGHTGFGSAFRATAVGFAANAILPARAGEVIRPYFLARQEQMSATGAFATIILERVLDALTVLVLLAVYVFLLDQDLTRTNPTAFAAVKWAGLIAAGFASGVLVALFVLAGDPRRLRDTLLRLERVVPSTFAGMLARIAEKFATGLAAVRSPRRLLVALVLSLPLWISICVGIWAVAVAFELPVPFSGTLLMLAFLVIGVALPTPGGVGGFHSMFLVAATTFFGATNQSAVGAAIVLHLISFGPSLVLGLAFAAQEGLNVAGMRQLASQAEPRGSSLTP